MTVRDGGRRRREGIEEGMGGEDEGREQAGREGRVREEEGPATLCTLLERADARTMSPSFPDIIVLSSRERAGVNVGGEEERGRAKGSSRTGANVGGRTIYI